MAENSDPKIRVAVAQIKPQIYDIDSNVEKHLEYVEMARKEKADVLLFPEYSLCGTHLADDFLNVAISMNDPRLKEIANASENMATMVGFVEEGFAAQFYNSCIVLQKGRDPFIHRKMNLCTYGYWAEGKYFAQGRYLERFRLPGPFNGVILICADMWNPALVHLGALHGASVVFAPIASAVEAVSSEFSNPDNWDVTLRFYSMMYGMHIVMANLVGKEGDVNFYGHSCIVDPFGTVQKRLGRTEEGLLVADLRYNDVRRARFELPTVRDSNFTLIQRELQRIAVDLGVPVGMTVEEHDFGQER